MKIWISGFFSGAECNALKCVFESKDFIIQKASEGNTIDVREQTKHIEEIKSLLSDSSNFMQFLNAEMSGSIIFLRYKVS